MLVRNQQMSTKRFRSHSWCHLFTQIGFQIDAPLSANQNAQKRQLRASSFIYFIYSFMVFSISEITFGIEFGNRWSNELSSDGHLAPPGGGRFIGTGLNRTNSPNRSPKQKRRQTRM